MCSEIEFHMEEDSTFLEKFSGIKEIFHIWGKFLIMIPLLMNLIVKC